MKLFLTFLVFIPQLLFTAARAEAFPAPEILGRWVAENNLLSRDVQFQLNFDFSNYGTQLTVNCYFNDGAYMQASTYSATSYYGNQIYIQETRENVMQDGIHFCRATLAPSTWVAYFDGTGHLILQMPIPYQARFGLVRARY